MSTAITRSGLGQEPAYFVMPRFDRAGLYQPARAKARAVAWKVSLGIVLVLLTVIIVATNLTHSRDQPSSMGYLGLFFLAGILGCASNLLTLSLGTRTWWNRLTFENVSSARALLYDSLRRMKLAEAFRAQLIESLDVCLVLTADADREFETRHFSAFWDQVEQVAGRLCEARDTVDLLRKMQREYVEGLQKYCHNLPPSLPACRPLSGDLVVLDHYHRVIRKAQSDIEFATIWEHRQTRAVLFSGFQSVGELILNIGLAIRGSIENLVVVEGNSMRSVKTHS